MMEQQFKSVHCPECAQRISWDDKSQPCKTCNNEGYIKVPTYVSDPASQEELLERYQLLNPFDPEAWHDKQEYLDYCQTHVRYLTNKCPNCDGEGAILEGGAFNPFFILCETCEGMLYIDNHDLDKWKKLE